MAALNPEALDEFLELIKEAAPKTKEELKATQRKEIDLWHTWNNNGRQPEHMKPLYESFKPLVQKEANKFRGVEMPKSSIDAEFRKHFVNAMKTYDPKKGTQLNTWVTRHMQKGSRFVKNYQNLGRISEGQISKIREFKEAKSYLTETLGHEPDTHMIADHMKLPHRRVAQLQRELREDRQASAFIEDPTDLLSPKELEAVHIIQYDTRLTPEERSVYEYTFGINGRQKLQPGQISRQTGLHPSKVSRIRGKLKTYLKEAEELL